MSALPYVSIPELTADVPLFGTTRFSIFGACVAAGLWLGWRAAVRFGQRHALDAAASETLSGRVVLVGLVVAHWASVLAYFPERVVEQPWVLLNFTSGLSSTGGFLGGLLAFMIWSKPRDRLRQADQIVFGLLIGFTLGRLGCALVHDHPGALAEASHWLAVGPWPADGSYRFDLGLIEFVGCALLTAWAYLVFDWTQAPPGRLTGIVATTYAISRLPLDMLRADDARYGGLTFAQYACLGLGALGVVVLIRSYRARASPGSLQ